MENMTKLAIISDIHANKYALDAFLNYNEEVFHADKILNLGDFVHIGPHPKEVTDTILNDNRFENVIGNNEVIMLGRFKRSERLEPHTEWTRTQLGEELIGKIEKIPTHKTLTINNKKLLMLHSHFYDIPGRTVQDNLLLYQEKPLEEFLADYPDDVDFVLVGHSHEQLYISWKGKKVINPGSISITWKPIASFCLLEYKKDYLNIEFKNISYDLSNLKSDYNKRDVYGKEFLIRYFYPFL
ncbi:MAG: metallophosphoesterase family protein [Promethearchaeota archaeon]|jgi:putative phosphoesterase